MHEHDHLSAAGKNSTRLLIVLGLTGGYALVEVAAGLMTHSLVLLADAGHMVADAFGLSMALASIWFAHRPATQRKTYGYYRLEILAALVNALILGVISLYILTEAYLRFASPPEVNGAALAAVAGVGLALNMLSGWLLLAGAHESLNIRAAFTEVLSDLLGSAGALAAGAILLLTGWRYADTLFALAIGLFILPRTWALLRAAVDVLLEGTPSGISITGLQLELLQVPGVVGLHDLHVWEITSGFVAMSGHVVVTPEADRDAVLVQATALLHDEHDIEHVTLQVEPVELAEALQQACIPGATACYLDPSELTAAAAGHSH